MGDWSIRSALNTALDESWVLRAEARFDRAATLTAAINPRDGSWRARAACAGVDPDVFFRSAKGYKRAKATCASCPVNVPCLADLLGRTQFEDQWGYGGCATPNDRRHLRRHINRSAA